MDLELQGKVAVVTGGSMGIGKAIALELAREGTELAICARRVDVLEKTCTEIATQTGRKVVPVPTDVSQRESVEKMVETVMSTFGRIDILVNSAGFPGGLVRGHITEAQEDDLYEDMGTKLFGCFRCTKAVAPHMQQQGWGRIINIGGLSGRSSGNISAMRNAGMAHFTKTMADQLGPYGINVNLIHPGATITERSEPMYAEQARQQGITVDEVKQRVAQRSVIRKIVDAQEIGYVAAFLASPKAISLNGEIIAANGGTPGIFFH